MPELCDVILLTKSGELEIRRRQYPPPVERWRFERILAEQYPGARVLEVRPAPPEYDPNKQRIFAVFILEAEGVDCYHAEAEHAQEAAFAVDSQSKTPILRVDELRRLRKPFGFCVEVSHGKAKNRTTDRVYLLTTCPEAAALLAGRMPFFDEKHEPRIEAVYRTGRPRRPWKPKPLKPTWRIAPIKALPGAPGLPVFPVAYAYRTPDGELHADWCDVAAASYELAILRLRQSNELARLPEGRCYNTSPKEPLSHFEAQKAHRAGQIDIVFSPTGF